MPLTYDSIQNTIVIPLLRVLAILLLAWLGLRLEKTFHRRITARISALARDTADKARLHTLGTVASYILRMFILGVSAIILLSSLGFNIGPLLASAGVAGLAVSPASTSGAR